MSRAEVMTDDSEVILCRTILRTQDGAEAEYVEVLDPSPACELRWRRALELLDGDAEGER
jgi:hypothetical protein